jgi:hypothetical protein
MGAVDIYAVVWPRREGDREWVWQVWVNSRAERSGRCRTQIGASLRAWIAVRRLTAAYASRHVA